MVWYLALESIPSFLLMYTLGVRVVGALPSTQDTWVEFLASGLGPSSALSPAAAVVDVCGVS